MAIKFSGFIEPGSLSAIVEPYQTKALELIKDVVSRITFISKPRALPFKLTVAKTCTQDGLGLLQIESESANIYAPETVVLIRSQCPIAYYGELTEEKAIGWICDQITQHLIHELQETLRLDGKQFYFPHG